MELVEIKYKQASDCFEVLWNNGGTAHRRAFSREEKQSFVDAVGAEVAAPFIAEAGW